MNKILFMHGGGPTAVINASLSGAISEAYNLSKHVELYAARFGTGGALKREFIKLPHLDDSALYRLSKTPGSAIGTGRDHLEKEDYITLANIIKEEGFDGVVLTGGNGTMDTARSLAIEAEKLGVRVVGIPKTMDNDLSITDHSPGFPSAAKYISSSVREVSQDVRSLPIHAVVIEAFGRDAGWITASSALSGFDRTDMILLPEVAFDEDKFLSHVDFLMKIKSGIVIVASEGLRDKNNKPIVKPVFQTDRSVYFGDVSSHLAMLITKNLGIKSRSEKPGILGRASIALQSELDRKEAIMVGSASIKALFDGRSSVMSIIKADRSCGYSSSAEVVAISDDILKARVMDNSLYNSDDFSVSEKFLEYLRPLVGSFDEKYEYFI